MREIAGAGVAMLLAGLMASGAWAQGSGTAGGTGAATNESTSAGAKGSASPLINGPETNFRAASSAFTERNYGTAAQDIRKGAALIRMEANRPDGETQTDLLASAAELESLAGNVEKGEVSSPYDLSRAFARADLAVARHYHMMAEDALNQHNSKQAADRLGAATDYVNDSVAWNARQLQESGSPVVRKMRALQKSLQEKIASGAHSASQETAKGLDALGKDLQQLSQKMSQ